MDLMRSKPDNYYDLAIVDPPYGIGIAAAGNIGSNNLGTAKNYGIKEWDATPPSQDYFNELMRVSKNQIIWGANHYISRVSIDSPCWVVWDKDNAGHFADCELAWTSFQTAVRIFRFRWAGMLQGDMKNKERRIHPTQKPVKLYEWLLMNYATCKTCRNEGGYYEDVAGDGGSRMWQLCDDCTTYEKPVKILDTHGGSGSICLACHNLKFDLDWIELDENYYNAAVKRYERHAAQLRIF